MKLKERQQQQISQLNIKIEKIVKSQIFLSNKYENLRQIMDGLIKENINLKKENQDQDAEIKEMKKQIKNEKQVPNDSDQHMRREIVQINGFLIKKGENLKDLVRRMASDMKIPLANEDTKVVHRLSTQEIAGIIIKFASRLIAKWVLANKRGH